MNEIQRYSLEIAEVYETDVGMIKDDFGAYVEYRDHASRIKQLEQELAAALAQANVNEQSQAQQTERKILSFDDNGQLVDKSQAQQPEYTFDQLTKMMMQAATKEGHKVTMKIKWAQPPAPEGGDK